MARNCPSCKTRMNCHEFHHVTVETCTTCELIWFDVDDLLLLLRGDPKAIAELSLDLNECGVRPPCTDGCSCPDCNLRLEKTHYLYDTPIVLYVCPKCEGFFTLKSDLASMQRWLDYERVESSVRHAGFRVVKVR